MNSCSANSPSRSSSADPLGHLRPHGDRLKGYDIPLATVERAVEVGEADPVVARLAREDEPLDLALVIVGVEDHQFVAVGVAWEVGEPRPRAQVVLLAPHPLQLRREALVAVVALDDPPPLLALLAAPAPVQLEQHVAVEVRVDVGRGRRRPHARPRTAAREPGCRCAQRSAPCRRWSAGRCPRRPAARATRAPPRGSARPARRGPRRRRACRPCRARRTRPCSRRPPARRPHPTPCRADRAPGGRSRG